MRLKKTTPTQKGDYKPLVFLLTDGQPTDKWKPAAEAVRRANNPKIANIYAIGCGPDVDTNILRQITDIVLKLTTSRRGVQEILRVAVRVGARPPAPSWATATPRWKCRDCRTGWK